jgi:uncharacterized membrane protein
MSYRGLAVPSTIVHWLLRRRATLARWLLRVTLVLVLLIGWLLTAPLRPASACLMDPMACVDATQYSLWSGVAVALWGVNRGLLQLSYAIGQFRWWVIEVAFGALYDILARNLQPLISGMAVVAITLAIVLFWLRPLLGPQRLVDLRQAALWVVVAPTVLTVLGPRVAAVEQWRSDFAGRIVEEATREITSVPLFGARASDMPAPEALYPANPCGNGQLERRDAGIRPDDLAAALVGASAGDIHCPDKAGPSSTLPDAFFTLGGPVEFATTKDVGNDLNSVERKQAVEKMQAGVTRLALLLLPALLAVLDALVNLVFALCLAALWLGLPISLVVVCFRETSSAVSGLFRQTVRVLQVSWSTSALMGLLLVCLRAAAELTNASAYAGFALGGVILTAYFLVVACQTLTSCIQTINATTLAAFGLSASQPFSLAGQGAASVYTTAGGVAGAATAAISGGAGAVAMAALAYGQARQQGLGRNFALTAALGTNDTLMQAGQAANAVGWLDDDGADTLYAGNRTTSSLYHSRRILQGIARRQQRQPDPASQPFGGIPAYPGHQPELQPHTRSEDAHA